MLDPAQSSRSRSAARAVDPVTRQIVEAQGRELEAQSDEGGGFWGWLYFSLWLQASLLAALVAVPRADPAAGFFEWTGLAVWIAAFGLVAGVVAHDRPLIHDLLNALSHRERIALGFLLVGLFLAPILFQSQSIVPHGFLWSALLSLLLSASQSRSRRLLALTLAGAWFAALRLHGPFQTGLLLAFAIAWLFALGMSHLAFVGDAYGYSSRRATLRIAGSALATALPAALAGVAVFFLWPGGGWVKWKPSADSPAPQPKTLTQVATAVDLMGVVWDLAVLALLIAASLALLYFLRRWWLNRNRDAGKDLLPGQTARMEYAADPLTELRPYLGGVRGRIVRLWGAWERAMAREGLGRRPGETASEFSRRLAAEAPGAAPAAAVADLLNQAHYGAAPVGEDDFSRMRTLVNEELSRQSLRLQSSQDSAEE